MCNFDFNEFLSPPAGDTIILALRRVVSVDQAVLKRGYTFSKQHLQTKNQSLTYTAVGESSRQCIQYNPCWPNTAGAREHYNNIESYTDLWGCESHTRIKMILPIFRSIMFSNQPKHRSRRTNPAPSVGQTCVAPMDVTHWLLAGKLGAKGDNPSRPSSKV